MRCRFDVSPSDGGYSVTLTTADGRSETARFSFDLTKKPRLAEVINRIDDGTCAVTDLQDAGTELWNALCPRELVPLFNEAKAAAEGDILGIALDIPLLPDLDALPWEAMYDEKAGRFLGCNTDVALYRVPSRDTPPPAGRKNDRSLRLLTVVPERSNLKVPYEWSVLRELESRGVQVEPLDNRVTVERLSDSLRQRFDIFHYIGHGDFDDRGVFIRLNDSASADGATYMDAARFAMLLENRGIQLAVMNCCLSAPSVSKRLAGLGPQLSRTARIPAVVAMRYEIDDSIAIQFAQEFYRELFSGERPGRVDWAMQVARKTLLTHSRSDTIRGCITPILYVAEGREQLFNLGREAPAPQPADDVEVVVPVAPPIDLPQKLLNSLRGGRCIPVIGSEIHSYSQVRREAAAPTLRQIVAELLQKWEYPEAEELRLGERLGEGFVSMISPRFFQHAEQSRDRAEIIACIEAICAARRSSPLLEQIATWEVPGVIYTHIDGLMVSALSNRRDKRVMNVVELAAQDITSAVGRHAVGGEPLLLINLRGSLSDPSSLVLSETDHDALDDRLSVAGGELGDLLTGDGLGRTVLFLGVHPRDPVVRRLCKTHLSGKAKAGAKHRVTKYFVAPQPCAVDEASWQEYDVQWIHEDPGAVVRALTAARGAGA